MSIQKLTIRYSELYYAAALLDLFLDINAITQKQYNEQMRKIVDLTIQRINFIAFQTDPDYNKEY